MANRQNVSFQSTPGGHIHLTDYLRIVYKRRWTAVLAFLVVFVFGAMNTLKKTPIYEASTRLLIDKEARRANNISAVLDDQGGFVDDEFYNTQFQILQSRGLAWKAIEAIGLNKPAAGAPASAPVSPPAAAANTSIVDSVTAWASNLIGAPQRIEPPPADETTVQAGQVGAFLGGLSVYPLKGTRIVAVTYRSADPVRAAVAANAIADQYIRQSLDSRGQASKEAGDYLKDQLEEQRRKLSESENALARYKETHDAAGLDDKQNTVSSKLADISAQATKAQLERIDAEMKYKNIQAAATNRDMLEALPQVISNIEIQRQKSALAELEQKRDQDAAQHGTKMQALSGIGQQISDARTKLWSAEDKIVEVAKNEFVTAQLREQSYKDQLSKQNQEALNLDRKGVEYAALQREASSNKAIYDNLLTRTKELGISSEFKGSSIRVMDRAEIPRSPVLPDQRHDLMVAAMQGLALAMVLVFGFEYLDSRLKTPDEIKTHLGLPFLGLVPSIPKGKADAHSLLTDDVPQAFQEAIRAVRTAVIFSSADEGARTVIITSTAPGEGKTMVSLNLAVALAQANQRTVIVDGDMRRPRVHEAFDKSQEPGLSNVLVGSTSLRDAVRSTTVPNLCVLAAGHIPPNPAELIGSMKYLEVLEELRGQFDWILIDAPPVMAVTDAAILSNTATGVIFVVGSEMTSRRNAVAAVEQLQQARAKFIGAVLNRVNLERHSYYYSPYYRKDYTKVYERTR